MEREMDKRLLATILIGLWQKEVDRQLVNKALETVELVYEVQEEREERKKKERERLLRICG